MGVLPGEGLGREERIEAGGLILVSSINLYIGESPIKKHNMKGRGLKKWIYVALFLIGYSFTTQAAPGTVNYYWNLTDTNNSADWLVIAYDDFYNNVDIYRLAQFRAISNSFDVGIVNLSDVAYQFNNTEADSSNDTAIKNLIAFIYENWTKKERVNNDIFVLLVGDTKYNDDEIDYMPMHPSDLSDAGEDFFTDNWYADVNGSDYKPDVYIGRFSVKDNENLSNMANKTIKYENETIDFQQWGKQMFFINGNADSDVDTTFNEIKSTYTNQFLFSYLDLSPLNGYRAESTQSIIENISEGRFITNYIGGGSVTHWIYSAGTGFHCSDVNALNNSDNLTIIFSMSCNTGIVNYSSDSLGECITRTNDNGAVAFFGSTFPAGATTSQWIDKMVFEAIFENNSATLGGAIKFSKDKIIDWGGPRVAELYNLLGDPALGIKDYRQPDISITHPSNATVASDDLNFSLFESNLDSCWYSNDSGFTNSSISGCINTTLGLSDGEYNILLWANDTNGNENVSYAVDFLLDTTYPNISLSSPSDSSPWTSSSTVNFGYAVTDVGIANCSLVINDAISTTSTSVTVDTNQELSASLSNGAYTWSINCTDNAGNENSSASYSLTVTYTAPSSGSGGGGGGGMTVVGGDNAEMVTLVSGGKAGETKTLSFTKDVGATEIGITLKNEVSKISLTVEKLTDKPSDIALPFGKIHSYLKIDKDINDADISKAKIKFKVDKAWFAQNGYLAEEILLKHYKDDKWETLPTQHLSSDANYHYYTAESTGFSYFAITAEKKPAPETTEPKQEQKEEQPQQQPQQETKQQEPPKQSKLKYALYGLLAVLASGIIVAGIKGRNLLPQKKKEAAPKELPDFKEIIKEAELKEYCMEKLEEGYTKEDLLQAARQQGKEEKIKKIIEKL